MKSIERSMRPDGMTAWLIEDAYIPNDLLLKIINKCSTRNSEIDAWLRERIDKGGKHTAWVYLVTLAGKRLWCAFAGGNDELEMTPIGSMTCAALLKLPGVPPKLPLMFAHISRARNFDWFVSRTLMKMPDQSLICFIGDMAGELDALDLEYMKPIGLVKAAVKINAAGWPVEWRPLSQYGKNND
jgi:hypothetical protein